MAFNRWREGQGGVSVAAISRALRDGGQLAKWASGTRRKLPLGLLVALSRYTGLPMEDLAASDQLALARELAAAVSLPTPEAEPSANGGEAQRVAG